MAFCTFGADICNVCKLLSRRLRLHPSKLNLHRLHANDHRPSLSPPIQHNPKMRRRNNLEMGLHPLALLVLPSYTINSQHGRPSNHITESILLDVQTLRGIELNARIPLDFYTVPGLHFQCDVVMLRLRQYYGP